MRPAPLPAPFPLALTVLLVAFWAWPPALHASNSHKDQASFDRGTGQLTILRNALNANGEVLFIHHPKLPVETAYSLGDLWPNPTVQGPERPGWLEDWWVAPELGSLILLPTGRATPVIVSLVDGSSGDASTRLLLSRALDSSVELSRRTAALERALAKDSSRPTVEPQLVQLLFDRHSPLLLRLRAAAALAEAGDLRGTSLVLQTAHPGERAASPSSVSRQSRDQVLGTEHCTTIPEVSLQQPQSLQAARSYAIGLLPVLLGPDASPWLGALLSSTRSNDRFAALRGLACLADSQQTQDPDLLERLQARQDWEQRQLQTMERGAFLAPHQLSTDLRERAHSIDVAQSNEAVARLIDKAPTSHPLLLELLKAGSSEDRQIARHFTKHPDPSAVGPLLAAIQRYRHDSASTGEFQEALAGCLPLELRSSAPLEDADPRSWMEWGKRWKRARVKSWLHAIGLALIPLLLLCLQGARRRD